MSTQNVPYAAIQMKRFTVKRLAQDKIDELLAYREERENDRIIAEAKMVAQYRAFWYVRIFGRKWDDARLMKEYASWGLGYFSNTSSEYRNALTDSKFAGEKTISFCRSLTRLASIETPGDFMWISDEAYRKISPRN